MRTKILAYSKTDFNKVVSRYEDLQQINESVYTYLYEKSDYGDDSDLLGVVLKVENIYFQDSVYSRQNLARQDLAGIGSNYVANFRQIVAENMKNGYNVTNLQVQVFEELGWDIQPLRKYQKERTARIEAEREREREEIEKAKKRATEAAAENERIRLDKVKSDFLAGKFIETDDFIQLCKQAGVSIPLRTHGTLKKSVVEVHISSNLRFYHQKGKRKPDIRGSQNLILKYAAAVSEDNIK